MNQRIISILAVFLSLAVSLYAQESKYGEKTFAGLELRPLGPALTARFLSNSATQLPSNSAHNHPLSRAIRAASMRFTAPSFEIASER